MSRFPPAGVVITLATFVAVVACTPSRQNMADDAARGMPEALRQPVRWLGADADKDRAVDDAVKALLAEPLTLEGAAEIALVRNRRVQVAYESLGLAQADLVDAGLLSNPRLSMALRFHADEPTTQVPGLEVGVDMSFLSVLFLAQRISIADARADAATARVVDAVVATAADARRAAVMASANADAARLMRAELEAAEGTLLLVRQNTQAGNQTPLDLAEEELRYQQMLLSTADAERAAQASLESLKVALGLFGNAGDVTLAPLPSLPEPGPGAVVDVVALEREALKANLTMAAQRSDLDAAARELGYASIQRFLPDLDLGVEAEYEGHLDVGPSVGIGLPIMNMGQGEILRRESLMRRQAAMVQQHAVRVRATARQVAVAADISRRRAHQITTAVLPQHLVVVDELERRLNGMLVFPSRVFQGRQNFLAARRQEVMAIATAWQRQIDVEQLRQGGTPMAQTMFDDDTSGNADSTGVAGAEEHD
jgi:cobalt-zinc-cadmium efflux system outer membrane protein